MCIHHTPVALSAGGEIYNLDLRVNITTVAQNIAVHRSDYGHNQIQSNLLSISLSTNFYFDDRSEVHIVDASYGRDHSVSSLCSNSIKQVPAN